MLRNQCGLTIAEAAYHAFTPKRTWAAWEQRPGAAGSSSPPGIAFAFLLLYRQLHIEEEDVESMPDPNEYFYEKFESYRKMLSEDSEGESGGE